MVQLLVQNTGSGSALNLVGGAGAAPFNRINSTTKIVSLNAPYDFGNFDGWIVSVGKNEPALLAEYRTAP